MHIGVLSSSYADSASVFKDVDDYECTPAPYMPEHTWETIMVPKASAVNCVLELVRSGRFDCFVNLCDGAWDEDRAGVEVAEALEHYGAPYTGADPAFYSMSKEHMKLLAVQGGVNTARFAFCFNEADIDVAVENLTYPLILKHYNSGGSIGTTRESRVTNRDELHEQARRFLTSFGGFLVEEFIEGREFTVLVSDGDNEGDAPVAYVPIECSFPPGEKFKHFDMKWVEFEGISWTPVADAELAERLRDIARRAYVALKATSYGRCDLRMNDRGEIFFLEINQNCGLFYPRDVWGSADFILGNDPDGFHGFTTRIINSALRRFERRQPRFHLRSRKDGSLGCFALRTLEAGEMLTDNEGAPHTLASTAHLSASNAAHAAQLLPLPLNPQVHLLRSFSPKRQQYFRAAEPGEAANARFNGLNIVALTPVHRGQEIVVDYSTFGQPL